VPQNGIKTPGMKEFLGSLPASLKQLRVNDNWIKGEAVDVFVAAIPSLPLLEVVDISDCDIGAEGVLSIIGAFKHAAHLREFSCNYAEVDEAEVQYQCLELLFHIPSLKKVEFRGNMVAKPLVDAAIAKFAEAGKEIAFKDLMNEDEDDEDEEEEEDDEATALAAKLADLTI